MLDVQATIAAMKAAGMTPEQIVTALACIQLCPVIVPGLSQGHERDSRREIERERKRAYREKLRNSNDKAASEVFAPAVNGAPLSHDLSQNVPGTARDIAPLVSPAPLPLILEKTVEKEVLKKEGKGSRDPRATRLPADFVPDASCEAIAREHQFTRAHWTRTIDSFRDYWKAQPGGRGLKLDWQATCRNWLRREADSMKGPGNGKTTSNSLLESAAVLDAHYEERIREAEAREGAQRNAHQGTRDVA